MYKRPLSLYIYIYIYRYRYRYMFCGVTLTMSEGSLSQPANSPETPGRAFHWPWSGLSPPTGTGSGAKVLLEDSIQGVFIAIQAKDPQTDGETEQGPPSIYI